MLCECCKKEDAVLKDFREDLFGWFNKFYVCKECFNLEDIYFLKKIKTNNKGGK